MGFQEVLSGLKDKVLDAANFEVLKSAYELQEENNKQLKESNDLLREKVEKLELDNEQLRETNEKYKAQLDKIDDSGEKLSEVAEAILDMFLKQDTTVMIIRKYANLLPYTKIQIESGIDELHKKKIIQPYTTGGEWKLTGIGANMLSKK
jgi:SMC interacting uncharacterized protein involved in chromosome segregation